MRKLLLTLVACIVAMAASFTANAQLYVTGIGGSWTMPAPLTVNANDQGNYVFTTSTDFKMSTTNGSNWDNDFNPNALVPATALSSTLQTQTVGLKKDGGPNFRLPYGDGEVEFTITVNSSFTQVTVTGATPPTGEYTKLYLAGNNSNWVFDSTWQFETQDGNLYYMTGKTLSNKAEFKVAGNNWSPNYGDGGAVTINTPAQLVEGANPANCTLEVGGSDLTISFNATTLDFLISNDGTMVDGGTESNPYAGWWVNLNGDFHTDGDNGAQPNKEGIASWTNQAIGDYTVWLKIWYDNADHFYYVDNATEGEWVTVNQSDDSKPTTISGQNSSCVFDVEYNVITNQIKFTLVEGALTVPEAPSQLYIIGTINGNAWDPTKGVLMNDEGDSIFTAYGVTFRENDGSTGFALVSDLAEVNDNGGWDYVNDLRYGPAVNDALASGETPIYKKNTAWTIAPGTYNVTASFDDGDWILEVEKYDAPAVYYLIKESASEGIEMTLQNTEANENGEFVYVVENVEGNTTNAYSFAFASESTEWGAKEWKGKYGAASNGEFTETTTLEAKLNGGNFVDATNYPAINLSLYLNPSAQSWVKLEKGEEVELPELPEPKVWVPGGENIGWFEVFSAAWVDPQTNEPYELEIVDSSKISVMMNMMEDVEIRGVTLTEYQETENSRNIENSQLVVTLDELQRNVGSMYSLSIPAGAINVIVNGVKVPCQAVEYSFTLQDEAKPYEGSWSVVPECLNGDVVDVHELTTVTVSFDGNFLEGLNQGTAPEELKIFLKKYSIGNSRIDLPADVVSLSSDFKSLVIDLSSYVDVNGGYEVTIPAGAVKVNVEGDLYDCPELSFTYYYSELVGNTITLNFEGVENGYQHVKADVLDVDTFEPTGQVVELSATTEFQYEGTTGLIFTPEEGYTINVTGPADVEASMGNTYWIMNDDEVGGTITLALWNVSGDFTLTVTAVQEEEATWAIDYMGVKEMKVNGNEATLVATVTQPATFYFTKTVGNTVTKYGPESGEFTQITSLEQLNQTFELGENDQLFVISDLVVFPGQENVLYFKLNTEDLTFTITKIEPAKFTILGDYEKIQYYAMNEADEDIFFMGPDSDTFEIPLTPFDDASEHSVVLSLQAAQGYSFSVTSKLPQTYEPNGDFTWYLPEGGIEADDLVNTMMALGIGASGAEFIITVKAPTPEGEYYRINGDIFVDGSTDANMTLENGKWTVLANVKPGTLSVEKMNGNEVVETFYPYAMNDEYINELSSLGYGADPTDPSIPNWKLVNTVCETTGTVLKFQFGLNGDRWTLWVLEPGTEVGGDGPEIGDATYNLFIDDKELSTNPENLTPVQPGFRFIKVTADGEVTVGPEDEWGNSPVSLISIYEVDDADMMSVGGVESFIDGSLKLWDEFENIGNYYINVPEGVFLIDGVGAPEATYYFTTGDKAEVPMEYYLRGAFNEYSTDVNELGDWQLKETGEDTKVYEGTFDIPEGEFAFNIVDNEGVIWVYTGEGQAPSGTVEGAEDMPGLQYMIVNSNPFTDDMEPFASGDEWHFWAIENWEGGEVTVTADFNTKQITISYEEQEPVAPATFNIVGDYEKIQYFAMNVVDNDMTFMGPDSDTFEIPVTPIAEASEFSVMLSIQPVEGYTVSLSTTLPEYDGDGVFTWHKQAIAMGDEKQLAIGLGIGAAGATFTLTVEEEPATGGVIDVQPTFYPDLLSEIGQYYPVFRVEYDNVEFDLGDDYVIGETGLVDLDPAMVTISFPGFFPGETETYTLDKWVPGGAKVQAAVVKGDSGNQAGDDPEVPGDGDEDVAALDDEDGDNGTPGVAFAISSIYIDLGENTRLINDGSTFTITIDEGIVKTVEGAINPQIVLTYTKAAKQLPEATVTPEPDTTLDEVPEISVGWEGFHILIVDPSLITYSVNSEAPKSGVTVTGENEWTQERYYGNVLITLPELELESGDNVLEVTIPNYAFAIVDDDFNELLLAEPLVLSYTIVVPEPAIDRIVFTSPLEVEFYTNDIVNTEKTIDNVTVDLELAGNPFAYKGFQFDLTLPSFMSLSKVTSSLDGAEVKFSTPSQNNKDAYRVLIYNNTTQAEEGLANLEFTVTFNDKLQALEPGEYPYDMVISDASVIFSTPTGSDIESINGFTGVINVTITEPKVYIESVTVTEAEFAEGSYIEDGLTITDETLDQNITVGENLDLTVEVGPEDAEGDIYWTSDVDGVTVSETEDGTYYVDTTGVDGLTPGQETTVTVKATIIDENGEEKEVGSFTFTLRGLFLGDSNDNLKVTVADVVTTANYTVNKFDEVVRFDFPNANVMLDEVDGMQVIQPNDIVATVNIALNVWDGVQQKVRRYARSMMNNDQLVVENFRVVKDAEFIIPVTLQNTYNYAALNATVIIPEGMNVVAVTAGPRAAAHNLVYNVVDGKALVTLFSLDNSSFIAGEGALFNLVVTADANCGNLEIVNINASDAAANSYDLQYAGGINDTAVTGIYGVGADENADVRYFTIDGIEVVNPEAGQILIRVHGNEVEKVVIK